MNKELLSYYGKPIEEDQQYFVVFKNNDTVSSEVNGRPLTSRAHVAARFLTLSGADKYVKRRQKGDEVGEFSKKVTPPVKVKTPEELFEEEMKALDKYDQLLRVEDRAGFDLWLKRNNLSMKGNIDTNNGISSVVINNSSQVFISMRFRVAGVPYCCGGREMGSHAGECDMSILQTTDEVRFILFKYLAQEFDKIMKTHYANYGIISYVVNPGKLSEPSARIGMMLNFSQYFTHVSKTRNPNTKRELDIYIVNEEWPTNL